MSELLRISQVSKRYRPGPAQVCVLDHASLHVDAGEVVCVLASRGQGKSTLLRIAAGMESPDEGHVHFDGRALAELSDRELARLLGGQIAWAGKSGPRMAMRMLDYVALPLLAGSSPGQHGDRTRGRGRDMYKRARAALARLGGREVYTHARAALERVGALSCADRQWEQISDWERTLVELAQAIAGQPRLLLIDDLTDTLGIRETDELTALVRELCRERQLGILMGVSDGEATLRCDRILMLSGGKLIEGSRAPSATVIEFPGAETRRGLQHGS